MFGRVGTKADRLRKSDRETLEAEIRSLKAEIAKKSDEYHFVSDYTAYVRTLLANHSLEDAMAFAVGGDYDLTGSILVEVLKKAGLNDGMSIIDLGCGSGRVAKHLGLKFDSLNYLGIDIVPELLEYAASKSPADYRFLLNRTLSLPEPDASTDIVAIFSVITHLLHQESYVYLQESKRVLKPGGRVVFSFLESEKNWPIFQGMVDRAASGVRDDQLNMFTERSQIEEWALKLEMDVIGYDFGLPHDGDGQTVVVLEKR